MRFRRGVLILFTAIISVIVLLMYRPAGGAAQPKGGTVTVTVGLTEADVTGNDNIAIQKAIDRVAQGGGGTVLVKAGTYTINNSVRLASHITLRGEGLTKTILKKAPGVKTRLALDSDYGELIATVKMPADSLRAWASRSSIRSRRPAGPRAFAPSSALKTDAALRPVPAYGLFGRERGHCI